MILHYITQLVTVVLLQSFGAETSDSAVKSEVGSKTNKTCFAPTLDKFPSDLFSDKSRRRGAIAVHIAISCYIFFILAMLIQAYVIGAAKTMADRFRIASDSARNTIIIVGSLLPEFFCSLIGVFVSKGNISAGTVIGSCAANSLLTLGIVGLIITQPVKLSWYPLWRDNIFYTVTVTILLWTSYDHELRWLECLFLVAVYLIYLLIINFNQKVERGVRRIVLIYRTGDDEQEADQVIEKTPLVEPKALYERKPSLKPGLAFLEETIFEENSDDVISDQFDPAIDIPKGTDNGLNADDVQLDRCESNFSLYTEDEDGLSCTSEGGYLSEKGYLSERGYFSEKGYGSFNQGYDNKEGYLSEGDYLPSSHQQYSITTFARHSQLVNTRLKRKLIQGSFYITLDMDNYVDGPKSPFSAPEKWYMKILWALCIPAICIFHITIPDCRKPEWRAWYLLTLFTSFLWVGVLSYVLVWIAVEIGFIWKVPDSVMGFAFLATGLSVSEIVCTYLQTQAGVGSSAVYSIYGSNVFNITINLGFVWFLKSAIHNPYVLNSASIVYVNLCQLIIVLTPLFLQFTRWRLNKILGIIYLCLYLIFTSIVVLLEYDIIGNLNPPVCNE